MLTLSKISAINRNAPTGRQQAASKKFLCLALLFLFLPLLNAGSAQVAIVKTANVLAFNEALSGFASVCFEEKQEFDLLEDATNGAEVTQKLKSGNFRLYLAIGMQAALFLKQNFPEGPVVYTMVANPKELGLADDGFTGVAIDIPIREQMIVLRQTLKDAKKLGLIYTTPANDALADEVKRTASEEELEIVPASIKSNADIQKAMTEIAGRCDAVYIPPDPSLNSEEVIRYIASTSLARKIPGIGSTDRFVRAGALFAMVPDTVEAGRLAGEMANRILQGTRPSKIDEQKVDKPKIILNLKAAELLGITFPRNILEAASKVYQ